jgi:hypothetical protein
LFVTVEATDKTDVAEETPKLSRCEENEPLFEAENENIYKYICGHRVGKGP